jgi:acyl-coenzyme A thioesterase PaaI-like protein
VADAPSGTQVRSLWDRLHSRPGGRRLFSLLLGRIVPFAGTIAAPVEEIRPGYARVTLRDRRRVRNHLRSIHAVALANLAEVTSGLALLYDLPADARAILTGLSIDFLKKARGTLTAEAGFVPPDVAARREHEIESTVRDEAGDVVARARARWLIEPGNLEAAPR